MHDRIASPQQGIEHELRRDAQGPQSALLASEIAAVLRVLGWVGCGVAGLVVVEAAEPREWLSPGDQ
eukprot:4875170-Prymnesium_polylepis.1